MAAANTDPAWSRDEAADANPHLTRKRQRLSEEADISPLASDDGHVLVEALPPDEVGTSFDNAIALDDDPVMALASESFSLDPTTEFTPVRQLDWLYDRVTSANYVDIKHFSALTQWISEHVADTRDAPDSCAKLYLDDHEFFSKLGQVCYAILDRQDDLLEPKVAQYYDLREMNNCVSVFIDSYHELSLRILPLLPGLVDHTIARRDSGQVSKGRQHIGLVWYVLILSQTLCCHRASQVLFFFKNAFEYPSKEMAKRRREGLSQAPEHMALLLELLKRLTQYHRELSNSWEGIDAVFRIVAAVELESVGDIRSVVENIHMFVLPVICDKHPRALPDGFHDLCVSLGARLLTRLMTGATPNQAAVLYDNYVKSETDALIMEPGGSASDVDSLQNVSGGDHETLVELVTTAWTLAKLKSFIYSDIMDVRSSGISLLSKKLLDLFNAHRTAKENFEHPVLQYVARFMRANELTKYIFGPNSHASLVNHSQNIIGFLAATFAYTNLESDIIWHACTNSVETEFVKASFTVLVDLCRYLDLDHLLYLASKYAETPPSKLGKDAVESLTNLFQRVQLKTNECSDQKHRLATASISIDIMMRLTDPYEHPLLLQLRDTARTELFRFTSPPFGPEDRAQILSRCIPDLVNPSENATTSVEIIALFLPSITTVGEARDLLERLPFHTVVDEVGRYVDSCRQADEGDQPLATSIQGLSIRVHFVVKMLCLPAFDLDLQVLPPLFRYTIGDLGLNNAARDSCWSLLWQLCAQPEVSRGANKLIERFLDTEAVNMDLKFVTPSLINILEQSLNNKNSSSPSTNRWSQVLETPIWAKLVQAAEGIGAPQVSHLATEAVCKILFEYPWACETPRVTLAKCHADFARQLISRIRNNFASIEQSRSSNICQQLTLLDAVLYRSKQIDSSPNPSIDTHICLATEPEDEIFQCTLQVYCGGPTQPKLYRLQANASTTVSEVSSRLPSLTGAVENRIIVGGKGVNPVTQANDTLRELGVRTSGGILISAKHTMESDLGLLLTPPGTVEQEILAHFEDLEGLLDGSDDVASKAYHFLATISPPAQVRERVASPDASVVDLFPHAIRPWRCAYSLHVLSVHRQDFARIGVADDGFISHGVRLLVAILVGHEQPRRDSILGRVLVILTEFLQERPAHSSTSLWIEQPALFVDRLINICDHALDGPSPPGELQQGLLIDALKALLQAFRIQDSVWKHFTENSRVVETHKKLLHATDHRSPGKSFCLIKDFCTDASLPDDVADFYTKSILALLPDTLENPHRATPVFNLAADALLANKVLRRDESRARGILDSLTSMLWSYHRHHTESVDLPILDQAMLGLLKLLTDVIGIVKSFKKPLALPDLCTRIVEHLLFPPYSESSSRPLVDVATRKEAWNLVRVTCESEADFAGLLSAMSIAMHATNENPQAKYTGFDDWIRPATRCNGLPNLGMTCYMNSLLQQLYANVRFRKFIFEVPIVDDGKQVLLAEVQKLFANMQNSYALLADTNALAKVLNIQTDSQEDVHGFYEDLLARLETNMPNEAWKAKLNCFYSGKQLSQIKGECGHVSPRTEPFVDLPVIIKNKTGLSESLDEFVQGEPMQGANKYKCQACDTADGGRLVDAVKRACPEEIPDNLTFCLKRFTFEAMLGVEGKVNDRFEFPQAIDMSPYKAAHLDDPASAVDQDKFELVGVIVHQGTLQMGHYWSYTLLRNTANRFSRTWVKLEDRHVSPVPGGIREVQQECFGGQRYPNGNERTDNAYVLFYERVSSLEEPITLPGLIVDPVTQVLLPPRVLTPKRLDADIHNLNAWRFRIAHLFDPGFADMITWIMHRYEERYKDQRLAPIKAASPTESDHPSSAEGSIASPTSDEGPGVDRLVQAMNETVMTYVQRLAVVNWPPERRLEPCLGAYKALITAQPDLGQLALCSIVQDPTWFENIVQHHNKHVRSLISDFIVFCLKRVRDYKQAFYDQAFEKLAELHSQPTSGTSAVAQSLDWGDYLQFASCLAAFGERETGEILNAGYWRWALELLHLSWDEGARKKYPGLAAHFRSSPAKAVALFDFVYNLLDGHVNLRASLEAPLGNEDPENERSKIPGQRGIILTREEARELVDRVGDREILVWMRASRHAKVECAWQDYAPGKLVGLLSSPRSSPSFVDKVQQSLFEQIDHENEYLPGLISMTMHFCRSCEYEEMSCRVFQQLAKVIPLWTNSDKEFLKILPDAYQMKPMVVLSTMQAWSPIVLEANVIAMRDETVNWMVTHVFIMATTSSLESERVRQARRLVRDCEQSLRKAHYQGRSRVQYDGIIKLVRAVVTYLQVVQAKVNIIVEAAEHGVDNKLRTEVAEVAQSTKALEDLEAEVLSNWREDTGVSDVRMSVEASEDFASSEDWDDDDDESLQLGE